MNNITLLFQEVERLKNESPDIKVMFEEFEKDTRLFIENVAIIGNNEETIVFGTSTSC